jgi:glycosyltransferase involved in cell wall biosynthesis
MQALLPAATIRCIPCGIDDAAFIDDISPGDYVLFIGRLDMEHKGLDLLLRAWSKVCGPARIPLVIAGEGEARAELEAAISRDGLGEWVRIIGRVEGDAKRAAFTGSRIVVVPSRYETFGIVALEAMAAGKPVICFNIEHLNELAAPPWAEHVTPFDWEALGWAVAGLWANPGRCEEMGTAARQQARNHHWDSVARQQEEFYLEALAEAS